MAERSLADACALCRRCDEPVRFRCPVCKRAVCGYCKVVYRDGSRSVCQECNDRAGRTDGWTRRGLVKEQLAQMGFGMGDRRDG